jgi:DNA-binding NtrC family response regulator
MKDVKLTLRFLSGIIIFYPIYNFNSVWKRKIPMPAFSKPRIMVLDDEKAICESIADILGTEEYDIRTFTVPEEALEEVERSFFDLAFIDLKLPNISGLEVLEKIKDVSPDTEAIVISGFGSIETAVDAMRRQAFDFLSKPIDINHLEIITRRALEHRRLYAENVRLRETNEAIQSYAGIIGQSPSMQSVYQLIRKVSPTNSNVLITGESGTGKELVAKTIHFGSERRDQRFLPINCSAIPETLLESTLFGHEKGAFTGAVEKRAGLLMLANGGSVFLDEIGEMPMSLQAKLLRVLDERTYYPVGGSAPVEVDIRLVAATNQDLEECIREKRFREDLYYRLNVVEIHLPSLRDRRDDIQLLARQFIQRFIEEHNAHQIEDFSPQAMYLLFNYSWPGNVRQLENVIERAVALAEHSFILPEDLPEEVQIPDLPEVNFIGGIDSRPIQEARSIVISSFEKNYLVEVLKKNKGNISKSAVQSGLSRRAFYNLIEKHRINSNQFRKKRKP